MLICTVCNAGKLYLSPVLSPNIMDLHLSCVGSLIYFITQLVCILIVIKDDHKRGQRSKIAN